MELGSARGTHSHSALEKVNTVSSRERRVRAWQLQLVPEDGDLVLVKQAQDQLLMQEP